MINQFEVIETQQMIEQENLDVRTITLGISLLDCMDSDLNRLNENIYNKITTLAKNLVETGEKIELEFGIPIVNKRISVTPIGIVGSAACTCPDDYVTIAQTLDKAAKEVGVNFIGGYSALVSKAMTKSDENLIRSIPKALAATTRMQFCECRFHKNGYQYGCRTDSWADGQRNSGSDKRAGFHWLCQTGCIL